MIVLQIVEAATGARSRPASFESLAEFVARFRAAVSENPDSASSEDYVLVIFDGTETGDSVQLSLVPMMRISSLLAAIPEATSDE